MNSYFSNKQHSPPFIIAEMSGNHNQSLQKALQIVDAAAEAGVNALKIQTYTADTMTLNLKEKEFLITDPKSPWNGYSLYELYEKAHTPWEWHKPIFDRCNEKGIIGFSTPFDSSAVDFLEELNVPFYKIASFENTDISLIKKVAQTKKPLIISTGMASISDLDLAVKTARENGCNDITLLKCTSSYPASPKDSNILTLPNMKELFKLKVGLSDHTLGIGAACASIAMGAQVIEKHLTLSRQEGGVDAAFSLEPAEFKQLVEETKRAYLSLGTIQYDINHSERSSRVFKRSLYIYEDLAAGEMFTKKNVRAVRPGYGLSPKYYDVVLGKKSNQSLKKGTPLLWEHLG